MDDHLMDDEGLGPEDEAFDRHLQEQLAQPLGSVEGPEAVLVTLQPQFRRAKRVRRAQLMAVAAGPLVLLLGFIAVLPRIADQADRQTTVAGEVEDDLDDAGEDAQQTTLRVTTTTAITGQSTVSADDNSGDPAAETNDDQQPTDDTVTEDQPDGSTSVPVPTSVPTTDPQQPPTSQPPSTVGPPTTETGTTAVPGSERVETDCGAIVVLVSGSSVELVETLPEPGYEVDIKSEGPEVEVSMEGEDGHCEIHADVENGQLKVETEDKKDS